MIFKTKSELRNGVGFNKVKNFWIKVVIFDE